MSGGVRGLHVDAEASFVDNVLKIISSEEKALFMFAAIGLREDSTACRRAYAFRTQRVPGSRGYDATARNPQIGPCSGRINEASRKTVLRVDERTLSGLSECLDLTAMMLSL